MTDNKWSNTKKHLMLFSGRAHPELGKAVSRELGVELVPTIARDLPMVKSLSDSNNPSVVVMLSSSNPTPSR